MTKMIHSYWAYLVLIILIAAVVNAVIFGGTPIDPQIAMLKKGEI